MNTIIEKFHVIGIAVKTVNKPQKAEIDIPQLWGRFMNENVATRIPNKISNDTYCMYTHYEGDYTQPYTTVIGCKVSSLDTIPEGMVGISIDRSEYSVFTATGSLNDTDACIIYNKWLEIWDAPLNRAYKADFEIYKADMDFDNASVDIFVGINK